MRRRPSGAFMLQPTSQSLLRSATPESRARVRIRSESVHRQANILSVFLGDSVPGLLEVSVERACNFKRSMDGTIGNCLASTDCGPGREKRKSACIAVSPLRVAGCEIALKLSDRLGVSFPSRRTMARTGNPRSRSKPVTVRPTDPSWPAAPITSIDPLSTVRLASSRPTNRLMVSKLPHSEARADWLLIRAT